MRLISAFLLAVLLALAVGCGNDDGGTTTVISGPTADAGDPMTVPEGSFVQLDASGSSATGAAAYTWVQVFGPDVSLSDADTATPSFIAPDGDATMVFLVEVSDSEGSDVAAVAISSADLDTGFSAFLLAEVTTDSNEENAEIVAFHAGDSGSGVPARVFTVNADDEVIEIIDLDVPAYPFLLSPLDTDADTNVAMFGDFVGVPNSVAVSGDVLAVALEDEDDVTADGMVAFYDLTTGPPTFISAYTAGPLPDMVTFSPDGNWCLVANEGEPDGGDPMGGVSIYDVSGTNAALDALTGDQMLTRSFDDDFTDIDDLPEDVRIEPGNDLEDLEPEYITVADDNATAYVTLQENNAVAVLTFGLNAGVVEASFSEVVALGFKDWSNESGLAMRDFTASFFPLTNPPVLGTTAAGQTIKLGGFSGLFHVSTSGDTHTFVTIPDRGPQIGTQDVDSDTVAERPFALPDYQARVVTFTVNTSTGAFEVTDETFLTRTDGSTPITGRPNILDSEAGLAYHDEEPVDLFGNDLSLDPYGGDFEGIVMVDGDYWMCDEYRPAIYHFNGDGVMQARYVPIGSNDGGTITGTEVFPAVYAQRRANRGFEAIAYDDDTDRLYAWIQSPIDNADVADDQNSKDSLIGRIIEFDPATEAVTGEYVFVFDGAASTDKIGDAVWSGTEGQFYVIERNSSTGDAAVKVVYAIDLTGATDLQSLSSGDYDAVSAALEGTDPLDLDTLTMAITPVTKRLYANLADRGYILYDKPEGLAMIDGDTLAVLNDNDFGIADAVLDTATGTLDLTGVPTTGSALALIELEVPGIDASDEDDTPGNFEAWPVYGMYMPDAIGHYTVDGRLYLFTANEGDDRGEDERVINLTLDPTAFPDAATLQLEENLGRLQVSTWDGDTDETPDGDYDELYSFGARSFAVWDAEGNLVHESSDQLERRIFENFPDRFNWDSKTEGADEDYVDTLEGESDKNGPAPEGIEVGEIDGNPYLFVGLEDFGGVAIYDIRNPRAPRFVTLLSGCRGPEGLALVPASESPNGQNLLIVGNEGYPSSVQIWQLDAE